jgi:hypothetical protein
MRCNAIAALAAADKQAAGSTAAQDVAQDAAHAAADQQAPPLWTPPKYLDYKVW